MDNQSLKRSQYMLLLAGFVHGSHLLFGFITKKAGHDHWMVLIAGFLISLPVLLVFISLSKRYPDKDLVMILEAVSGRVIGKLIAALYILFFFILLCFNLWDIASFYVGSFMTETPLAVFITVTALTSAYAVKKGMGSLARVSLLTISFGVFVPVITTLLLIGDMDFSNFLPVMEKPMGEYVRPFAIVVTVPFGEAVTLLMVLPAVTDKKRLGRYSIGGAAIVSLIFFIIGMRDIAVLGHSSEVYADIAFTSVRMINLGEFLNRIEILIGLVLTTASFVKISLIYYACVKGMSTLFSLKDYRCLILPTGSIAVALATLVFKSPIYHEHWVKVYAVAFSLPFAIGIPLIMLIVSLIRNRLSKRKAGEALPPPDAGT